MTKDHKYGLIFAVVFPLVGVLISSIMLSAFGCYSACKIDPHMRGIGVEN